MDITNQLASMYSSYMENEVKILRRYNKMLSETVDLLAAEDGGE